MTETSFSSSTAPELFISCITGLEPVLAQELQQLGFAARNGFGGVSVPYSSFEEIYLLNLHLRTASRVLLPLFQFECWDREELYHNVLQFDWTPYFAGMPTFAIETHGKHEAFPNSLFSSLVVKDALCDSLRKRWGNRPSVDTKNPQIRLRLTFYNKQATISFDTSGKPLHERGYRPEGIEAPLRETLAAALLLFAEYSTENVVVDPCCGSATLLIEAALIATKTAPGLMRKDFGFMRHPRFRRTAWEVVRKRAQEAITTTSCTFIGIEKSKKTYTCAKEAVQKSGQKIQLIYGDFRSVQLPVSPNFVITNPPYGSRLGRDEVQQLEMLYEDLGDFLKKNTAKPARGFVFSGNLELLKKIGLRAKRRYPVNNGGIECRLVEYDLY